MTLPLLHNLTARPAQGWAVQSGSLPRFVWDFRAGWFAAPWGILRASAGTSTGGDGQIMIMPAGEARWSGSGPDRGLLIEPASQNLLSLPLAATDLSGVYRDGDPAATLSLVDDSAALAAAGLTGLTSSRCFLIDNSAGHTTARMALYDTVDSTTQWVFSVWVRGSGGVTLRTGYGGYPALGDAPGEPALSASAYYRYQRNNGQKSAGAYNVSDVVWCELAPGAQARIQGLQWEAGRESATSLMLAAASRAAEQLWLDLPDGNYSLRIDYAIAHSPLTIAVTVSNGAGLAIGAQPAPVARILAI